MRECGCLSTTTLAQPCRPCRPRHPYAVPRTLFQCVCTRRRNCIGQLSPSSEYVPAARQINPNALFPGCRAIKTRATKGGIAFLVAEARPFDTMEFSQCWALSTETSACSSFGITGTKPWPRSRRLPPSSLLSWWLLALLRSRKVGSDKLTETHEITPYLLGHPGRGSVRAVQKSATPRVSRFMST